MGVLSVFGLGKDYDPEDDRLAAPDEAEGRDLNVHVERCAVRYTQLRKGQYVNSQRIIFLTVLVVAVLIINLLANGEKAAKVLAAIL